MKRPGFFARSDLGRSLWTFRKEFLWVGVFSFFANLLMLSPTLYMLQVFDRVMLSQNEFTLIALTLVTVMFFSAMAFAEWVRSRLLVRAGVRFDDFLNSRVFDASFSAGLSQGRARNGMQAFTDLTSLRQFLTGQGMFAFFDLPWTPIYLLVLFLMHPVLGWTSIAFVLFLGTFAWFGQKFTARRQELAMEGVVQSNAYLATKLRNAETVHAMGMLGSLRDKWIGLYEGQLGHQSSALEAQQRLAAMTKFIQYTQQSIILAVGALLVIRGEMSVGAMIASNALMNNSLRPITTLSSTWKQFVEARKAYGRIEQLLEDNPGRDSGHVAQKVDGQVTLVNLVATAPGREQPILKGLNAQFNAGDVVAIVGPSGAGKSTLARCILGIWPDTTGQVQLDGKPMAAWSRDELGPHIGYLPQDIELFDGTLAENIARFGQVDSNAVVDAATRTGIHEMILRFPKGYDTPMGEAGSLLSGGQRQRVGLARALYGDPDLIVLDEPNANLDDVGVNALVNAVKDLKSRGKTVFMVVHQTNLLSTADTVVLLENGSISRIGPTPQART
jgi:ATP-binding cassette subfamily C exporter for protease/lipase